MKLRDALGLTDSSLWLAVRAMQVLLVGVAGYAIVTFDLGLLANAVLPLLVTLTPEFVEWRYDHTMSPGLGLWIAAAAFLHTVGALGPYRWIGWYDQVTHTLSATLVAGVGYALVEALDESSSAVDFPPKFRFVFIVLFVVAFGVVWEIAEFASGGLASLFGGQAVLAQYGMRDIVLDLVFNGLGAVAVALWGTGYFDGVATVLSRGVAGVFGRQGEDG
ncbi:hypothetical protein G9464_00420 [Halostella sp. JP-L12]|uniref:hypothetical protein n=1 Tax=Halostella TaxID=1843185 RepID=UPI000EF759F4|nr:MULTISPECIES: hypothetical protein [Halostella]NHN46061.1 hypothetical protein [Halostella sp. JP-L12]